MNRLLSILFLLWICCVARAATPSYSDFDPTQFSANATGPQPKITLLISGTVSNYNITILVSSNFYSTNITVETIYSITNVALTQFTTNLFVDNSVQTNVTIYYLTVVSNANIVGYIRDFNGIGTNTTLYSPLIWTPFYFLSTNGPAQIFFLDADNSTILAGWDTNRNGFFGNGGGLTNLQGSIQSQGSTFGWITVTNAQTNLNIAANAYVGTDGNSALTNTANGNGWTNLTYKYTTNAINTGTFVFGKEWTTNIAGNITLGDFTLGDTAAYESMVIWVTNTGGSVFTVTLSGKVQGAGDGHPPVYYSTNGAGQDLKILVEHTGVLRTNSSAQHYW